MSCPDSQEETEMVPEQEMEDLDLPLLKTKMTMEDRHLP